MIVNEIYEGGFYKYFFKFGGMYSAFLNHKQLLEHEGVQVLVNSSKKADITHVHSFGLYALYKLMTARPSVVSTHFVPDTIIGSFKGHGFLLKFIKLYLRFFYNQADLIVALTPYVKKELEELGVTRKIVVLSNPINKEMFQKDLSLRDKGRKKYLVGNHDFLVVGAGQLIPRKGIKDFLEIAKRLPEYSFMWIGEEILKVISPSEGLHLLLKNKPENVIITGLISYDEMSLHYNMGDMLLFPSHQETQGLVIIEAAACGLPVVARDLEQYKELYRKDEYIGCENVDAFVKAVKFLAINKEKQMLMMEKSKRLSDRFSIDIIGEAYIKLYKSLL